jgi:acyl-CoA reductase-like NAD-dependent aldehyde dehydrogenase
LELGGNAACVVDQDADIADAVSRIIFGAFYQSGQSCIGVQRIYIHASLYETFKSQMIEATKTLVMGDPKKENTFIGPMISEAEAQRVCNWIDEAVAAGATLLCGGQRQGAILEASLLEKVGADQKLRNEEAFGPVAILSVFTDFDSVLAEINDSRFGLQAGIFTRDLYKAHKAWDVLDVGGVVIGDVPSWRVDHMPYGGVKDSGLGREGVRYAIEDMTEPRLMVIRTT